MTRRLLGLAAVVATAAGLALPAAVLAGGGGTAATPAAAHALRLRTLGRAERRLQRRYQVFSAHCLAQNAPDRCATAAGRLATRLTRVQTALQALETAIGTRCSATPPPARCARAGQRRARIDALLAKVADDLSAIRAAFPNAGSAAAA